MKIIEQISVFITNRPGRLCEVAGILSEGGVDIRALSLADTTDFGILRLIVDNPGKAEELLRAKDLTVRLTKVIAAKLDDRPGALHNVLRVLNDSGISVEYAYAFITRKNDDACVILRVEDNEKAIKILEENGIALLAAAEIYGI